MRQCIVLEKIVHPGLIKELPIDNINAACSAIFSTF